MGTAAQAQEVNDGWEPVPDDDGWEPVSSGPEPVLADALRSIATPAYAQPSPATPPAFDPVAHATSPYPMGIKPNPIPEHIRVEPQITPAFDPEGDGYDMETAKAAGLGPDATGHWPSRDPGTGVLLKGRKHPTWGLLEQGEAAAGMAISKDPSGRYVSRPAVKVPDVEVISKALTEADPVTPEERDDGFDENGNRKITGLDPFKNALSPYPTGNKPFLRGLSLKMACRCGPRP